MVDAVLDASVTKEADPLGMVPTASSFSVASSIGDAIASAIDAKDFQKKTQ